jgi:hypothetical protein
VLLVSQWRGHSAKLDFSHDTDVQLLQSSLTNNGYSFLFEPKELTPHLAKLEAVSIRAKLPDANASVYTCAK